MKKTVTTMLSLALAMILVSSLSSGVILAKGPSDNASDRGKERARYHTVHEVVIFGCVPQFPQMGDPTLAVVASSHPEGLDTELVPTIGKACFGAVSDLLNGRFKIEGIVVDFVAGITYTMVKKGKMRRENDED